MAKAAIDGAAVGKILTFLYNLFLKGRKIKLGGHDITLPTEGAGPGSIGGPKQ